MNRLLAIGFGPTFVALSTAFILPARAAEVEARQADSAAIRAAARQYLEARRLGNVDAMRAAWAPEGDYIDASGRVAKPTEFAAPRPEESQVDAPQHAPPIQTQLRFLTPCVAIEDGTIESEAAAGNGPAGRFTVVWVKRDGRWLIDCLRESAPAPTAAASNPRLQPLAWLLGEWAGKTDDFATIISVRWSDGGNYMVRDFVVRNESGAVVTATQRIGWDPLAQTIKSWSFDSHGGAGEATWRQDGPVWIVESTDVTADGVKSQSTSAYRPDGNSSFVWEVRSAKVGDEEAPPRSVKFTRAPEVDQASVQ